MTFHLTKDQSGTLSNLITDLTTEGSKIEAMVTLYNETVMKLRQPVEEAVTGYNRVLAEVRQFCSEIAAKAEDDISSKSEKWQDSETGLSAQDWCDAWEGIELDDLDFDWPPELEITVDNHTEALEDLPQEMDE